MTETDAHTWWSYFYERNRDHPDWVVAWGMRVIAGRDKAWPWFEGEEKVSEEI